MPATREVVSLRLSDAERVYLEELRIAEGLSSFSEAVRYCIHQVARSNSNTASILSQLRTRSSYIGPGDILVSAEALKQLREAGVSAEPLLGPIADCFRNHTSSFGFPLPSSPGTLAEVLTELGEGKERSSSAYLKSVFPSYWSAGKGLSERICEAGYLEAMLKYRVGLNSSGETFDIGWKDLYKAAQVQKRVVSFFRPAVARKIYLKYQPTRAWDPSSGFGGRMLGFHSATNGGGFYFGNEPASPTFKDNLKLARSLGSNIFIAQLGSEHGHPGIDQESIDLVFTSPPYFNKEKYFNDSTQAWFGRTHEQWSDEYVKPTLQHAFSYLKPGGFLVLNVPSAEPWASIARSVGFSEPTTSIFPSRPNVMAKQRGKTAYNELLIEWRKP